MRASIGVPLLVALLGVPSLSGQAPVTVGEGAQVYAATCSRCHNARGPSERSDREWGVIMTHMRTRGTLSGRDTRAVLLFLRTANGGGPATTAAVVPTPSTTTGYPPFAPQPNPSTRLAGAQPTHLPATSSGTSDTATAERGRKVIDSQGCMACHKVGEYSSGVLGPDLNTVFARRSEVWILKKLADPTLENTETVMPQMNLSAVDRASVVLYLRSVAKKK